MEAIERQRKTINNVLNWHTCASCTNACSLIDKRNCWGCIYGSNYEQSKEIKDALDAVDPCESCLHRVLCPNGGSICEDCMSGRIVDQGGIPLTDIFSNWMLDIDFIREVCKGENNPDAGL
jgi:hypothetical protein